jgi:hypothetical protein
MGAADQLHRNLSLHIRIQQAASYAEGYAHTLVDCGQIDLSTDRDLLIIATMDAWRCARTYPNTSTNLSYPGKP